MKGSQTAEDAWNLLDWACCLEDIVLSVLSFSAKANMILLLIGFTMRMLLFSDVCPAMKSNREAYCQAANANVGIEQLTNKEC